MNQSKPNIQEAKPRFIEQAMPHLESLHRTALFMVKDENEADELVQNTYIQAYTSWKKSDTDSINRQDLFKTMTKIFLDRFLVEEWNFQAFGFENDYDNLADLIAVCYPDNHPEDSFLDLVYSCDISGRIKELPINLRLILILSLLEKFSYREIADIAGLQIKDIRLRLHRGRKLVQESLWQYAVNQKLLKKPVPYKRIS